MKYNNRDIPSLTLAELQVADAELAFKEASWNEAMKHKKFEKFKIKPQLGETFIKLRQEIKDALKEKSNG